jgi:hypothetical protein
MPAFTLVLEGHADHPLASADDVERAIRMMVKPEGPTYIMLKNPSGGFAQAGGFNNRFRIETRDVYGEGFKHWLAASPTVKDRSDVVMHYRNHCDIHGRRRCPLPAWGENVLALADVLSILLFYQASGERLTAYPWEDVSQYFLEAGLNGKGKVIRQIRPHNREHEQEE